MIKRIYILTVTILIVILSMSVSVFAWFTYTHYEAGAGGFEGGTSEIKRIEIGDREKVEILDVPSIDSLTYLSVEDFNNKLGAAYLTGHGSLLTFEISNTNDKEVSLNILFRSIIAPEYGFLSGNSSSLKYLVLAPGEELSDAYQDVLNINQNRTFYQNINLYSRDKEITVAANSNVFVDVYFWGDYLNLTEIQKRYMQLVAYRLLLDIRVYGDGIGTE